MGQYTSRITSNRRERHSNSATSPGLTPIPSNSSTFNVSNDRLSLLRRRRSSNNTSGPPSRRRRLPERLHDLLGRTDNNSPITEESSVEGSSVQGAIQNTHREGEQPESGQRFIDELDSIATDLFNAVSSDPSNRTRHLASLSSLRSNESSTSLTRNSHDQVGEDHGVSLESQITMLSRLLEFASTSTLYTLLGRSNPTGRRFDNSSRSDTNDSTFQEFLEELRNGLLTRELGASEDDSRGNMSFFRAFRFDSLAEENSHQSPVPVMIVGVRSIQQPANDTSPNSSTTADFESRDTMNSQSAPSVPVSSNTDDISDTQDNPANELQQRSWVILVMGNTFNGDHPFLSAPSLLSENPTYEDLMNLQELLGQEKPPLAKKEDLKKDLLSEVKITDSFELKTKFAPKVILEGERCQICLSDYEDGEVVRRLGNCDHFYHQECIETWLLNGKNNCPLCRSKGVGESEAVA